MTDEDYEKLLKTPLTITADPYFLQASAIGNPTATQMEKLRQEYKKTLSNSLRSQMVTLSQQISPRITSGSLTGGANPGLLRNPTKEQIAMANAPEYSGMNKITLPRPAYVVHRIGNGYIVSTIPEHDGQIMPDQMYCASELEVGEFMLRRVAEGNLK